MIRVCTFKWRKPGYRASFDPQYVNYLKEAVKRNTTVKHEFVCITDDPTGIDKDIRIVPLWENPAPNYGTATRPNCFYRLKMFSPEMKELIGERFLWLDLDTVIVGNIDRILKDTSEFKIWKVDNEKMPCNGSMVLHTSGTRAHFWHNFDASRVHPYHSLHCENGFMGSDQAWIAQNLTAQDSFFRKVDGVYSFRCHLKKFQQPLPSNARIVFFHGNENPWDADVQQRFEWVRKHYPLIAA